MNDVSSTRFDPEEKEAALRSESESWDTSNPLIAAADDIPTLDIHDYLSSGNKSDLKELAERLKQASTEVGFYYLIGHGISSSLMERIFQRAKAFHALPLETKMAIRMDRSEWPVKGVGYLPFLNRKLPSRNKGNANEAFIIKREHGPRDITLNKNQWPLEDDLPGFRQDVTHYANAVETLALNLLPIYAEALGLPTQFFDEAFTSPVYRLRITKYPPIDKFKNQEFGIAPHVDTTFFTILAQNSEGLTIFSERRQCWLRVPVIENTFVINTGELLKQWTNDYFISVKHFANNNIGDKPRYSIPFFFNANADYKMECLSSCKNINNPPKYPPISYLESQGVVQGE